MAIHLNEIVVYLYETVIKLVKMNIYLCEIASHLYEMTINPSKYATDLSSYTLHLVTLASNLSKYATDLDEMTSHLGEMNIYLSETQTGTRFKRAPVLIENRKSVVAGNNFPGKFLNSSQSNYEKCQNALFSFHGFTALLQKSRALWT